MSDPELSICGHLHRHRFRGEDRIRSEANDRLKRAPIGGKREGERAMPHARGLEAKEAFPLRLDLEVGRGIGLDAASGMSPPKGKMRTWAKGMGRPSCPVSVPWMDSPWAWATRPTAKRGRRREERPVLISRPPSWSVPRE